MDYLLRFDDEAEAIAALQELRVTPPSFGGDPQPERWADTAMPVALVTADAVYGDPVDMVPVVISPRVTLPGFFLLTTEAGQIGQVAAIERETGYILAGDSGLAGARIDPAWAGAASLLSVGAIEPEPVPDGPTLSDWRVALIQMGRFQDVKASVETARDAGSIDGLIAWERFEYANHVFRAELLRLAPVFGFSEAEIDESLRAAAQVAQSLHPA